MIPPAVKGKIRWSKRQPQRGGPQVRRDRANLRLDIEFRAWSRSHAPHQGISHQMRRVC